MQVRYSIVALLLTACSGYTAVDSLPLPEQEETPVLPTLANAGADREVLRGLTSRLDGTGTFSPNGASATYAWEQVEGPVVFLSNPADLSPTFVAPLDEAALTFVLTVDDGRYVTSDTVTLWVKNTPSLMAPRVRAGADRIENYGGNMAPRPEDIAQVSPSDAVVTWEPLQMATSRMAVKELTPPTAVVFRLEAEASGLRSAPDYLVIWPYDNDTYGHVAPTCTLTAPLVVEPNGELILDASACADANADTLQRRWVQTRGDSLLSDANRGATTLTLSAPNRVQELVFRVYARDKALESAAAEVVVLVAAPAEALVPSVAPKKELLAHPENLVNIDATGASALAGLEDVTGSAPDPVTYTWTQTAGPPVLLRSETGAKLLSFAAPSLSESATSTEVAFSVVAQAGALVSDAAVVRVTVVDAATNQPPTIEFCTSATTLVPGQLVTITARINDPEHDEIVSLSWDSDTEIAFQAALAPAPGCDAGWASFSDGDVSTWQSIELTVPAEGTSLAFELTACDALEACNKADF